MGVARSRRSGVVISAVHTHRVEPGLAETTDLDFALWAGFFACLGSFGASIILNAMDKKRDTLLGIKEKSELPETEKFRLKDIKEFDIMF